MQKYLYDSLIFEKIIINPSQSGPNFNLQENMAACWKISSFSRRLHWFVWAMINVIIYDYNFYWVDVFEDNLLS
jgi:hypothetical protein